MSRRERMTLLAVAAVIAIVAILVLGFSGDDDDDEPTASTTVATQTVQDAPTTTTPTTTAPAEPTPEPEPEPPLLTGDEVVELDANKGDTVRLRVRSAQADEVHVHGYDITRDLEAGKTSSVSFKADITGIFEIELEQAGTQIAKLTVEP